MAPSGTTQAVTFKRPQVRQATGCPLTGLPHPVAVSTVEHCSSRNPNNRTVPQSGGTDEKHRHRRRH
jgi:hypothetical protein